MRYLLYSQHFLHYKSIGKMFIAHGQVTPKLMVRTGLKSNSSEILRLSSLSVSLTKIQSKMKVLSSKQNFLHYMSIGKIFFTQGGVTPKRLVLSGPKSNLSEILCLSSFPVSLMKIGSKWKALAWRHRFP